MQVKWSRRAGRALDTALAQGAKLFGIRSLVVHEHFKLIYYIDLPHNTLYIADLWDTRREPSRLAEPLKG